MSTGTIRSEVSLFAALDEIIYPQAALAAHPRTLALAANFDPVVATWMTVLTQEVQLRIAAVKARAQCVLADDPLNGIVDDVVREVLKEVNGDRTAPKYRFFFDRPPSDLKRPILGGQLETMRGWVDPLKTSAPGSAYVQIGLNLEAAVAAADVAAKALSKAEQDIREFRTIGARKALFDSLNAVRKSTEGKVSEMPHAHPEWNLPNNFSERFFVSDTKKDSAAPTAENILAQIADKEAELASLKEDHAKLKAAEDEAAKAKAESDAHDAEIAAAEKEVAALATKIAALKAKKKKK